jgi:inosose dehydratase
LNVSVVELAAGPVSWGVDFADAADNPPYEHVLDAIAGAGLGWMELGPLGYLPPEPAVARAALAGRELGAVGTFVFEDFHSPAAQDVVLGAAHAALDAITSTGGTLLVLIDRPSAERAATAGRSGRARRLATPEWVRMLDLVRRCAEAAAARGVRAVVHPHAGSFIEFEDEIERLLEDSELALCFDTGHALYAGSDPIDQVHRYADRIGHLHLKDIAAPVRERDLGFWDAVAAGIFCPVGDGLLNLPRLRDALTTIGYAGFATVEQDRRRATAGDPARDLARSVARLRAAGIG